MLFVCKVVLAREVLGKVNAEVRQFSKDLMGATTGLMYVELVHVYHVVRWVSLSQNFN